jgi:hypothetical protein
MPMIGPKQTIRSLRSLFTIFLVAGSIAKLFLDEKLIRREYEQNGGGGDGVSPLKNSYTSVVGMDLHEFQQQGGPEQRRPQHQDQHQNQYQRTKNNGALIPPSPVSHGIVVTSPPLLGEQQQQQKKDNDALEVEVADNDDFLSTHHISTNTRASTSTQSLLPPWMENYFEWHYQTRKILNETNCESYKYLVLRCLMRNQKCSGTSDRLQSIPTAIRLASDGDRLLFIQWERPAPLEEFLLPAGKLDWRLPVWLDEQLHMHNVTKFQLSENNVHRFDKITQTVVAVKTVRGNDYYREKLLPGEPSFESVYRDVWRSVFRPSRPVAAAIRQEMQALKLVPDQYVAAHVRSLYVYNTTNTAEEEHAVDCASQQQPGWPIYFASDSVATTRQAIAYAQSKIKSSHDKKNTVVVARIGNQDPLHLDRGRDFLAPSTDWKNRSATDFYDIFVDLYLLSSSRCVAYGAGGYGQLASLLSYNRSCAINHRTTNCTWTTAT